MRKSNNQNLKAIEDYYKNVTKDLEEYDKFVAKLNKEKQKDDKEVSDNFQNLEDEDLKYMNGNALNIIKSIKDKNTPDKVIDYDASKIIYENSDGKRRTMKKSY